MTLGLEKLDGGVLWVKPRRVEPPINGTFI